MALVVFVSRLGFLTAGYGTDPDAHRLAIAARQLRQTGHYVMSREPGHPVQEGLSALVCNFGPVGINALTALMSSLGVLFFAQALKRLKVNCPSIVALAYGFSPLYFVHSVDAMDYVWALAFTWAGVYFAIRGWAVAAGVALGLAVGCRVTEALGFFPLLLVMGVNAENAVKKHHWLRFGWTGVAVAALCYGPVFVTYGWSALRVYEGERTSVDVVATRLFVSPWGWPGLFALFLVGVLGVVGVIGRRWRRAEERIVSVSTRRVLGAALLAVVATIAVFLRLPHEAGYVLPVVPWVLLAMALCVPSWQVSLVSVAVMLGSASLPGAWTSPVWTQHRLRQSQVETVRGVITTLREVRQRTVVVAGTYQPKILAALMDETFPLVEVRYVLDRTAAERLKSQGVEVFYLRRALSMNRKVTGFDLRELGARPL